MIVIVRYNRLQVSQIAIHITLTILDGADDGHWLGWLLLAVQYQSPFPFCVSGHSVAAHEQQALLVVPRHEAALLQLLPVETQEPGEGAFITHCVVGRVVGADVGQMKFGSLAVVVQ
jgi:hypothetical protein